jgi:hypothetical protein
MKHNFRFALSAAGSIIALVAPQGLAQTKYAVSILAVPAPYLGGNVSAINNGQAVGWAYTTCPGSVNCGFQEAPLSWPNLAAPVDLTFIGELQLSSQMQALQGGTFGGYDTEQGTTHAVLVNPQIQGHVDLNGIFFGSKILAMCPGYQAGFAQTTPLTSSGGGSGGVLWHAMIWSGGVNTWTDLHNQMDVSQVLACDGNTQVGYAASRSNTMHAVMWTGARDQATAVSGNTQAGWGAFQTRDKQVFSHALIWHGAPNTLTDIHPAAFQGSQIFAAAGNKQVGYATNGNDPLAPGSYHGLLWFGTASSAIDLNQFLPVGYTDAQVDAIDPVTGIIAGAARGPKGVFEPAIWTPVQ